MRTEPGAYSGTSPGADPTPRTASDRDRFAQALDLATSGEGAGTLRRLAYPVYVTILIGLTYGFTITRYVFVASNPAWVERHLLTPAAAGTLVLLALVTAAFVWRACRLRGAVVPPLAWTDQVLVSSIDRAVALRPWWHLTLAAAITGGALLGALLGGSLWASTVTGPSALPVTAGVGAVAGALFAHTALWGQAGLLRPARPAHVLRTLRIEDLRTHAATGEHLVGALLAGDVRSGQLELMPPPRRGRNLRLRPGGPVATIIRRDLLGLRRDPFTLLRAGVLGVVGASVIAWASVESGVPPVLAAIGLVLVYVGTSALSEGLRASADQIGCPVLFGLTPPRAALAHTVLPSIWTLGVFAVAAVGVATVTGAWGSVPSLVLAGGVVTLAAGAATWLATYRPPLNDAVMMPGSGPPLLVLRMATPAIMMFIVGIVLPAAATNAAPADLVRLSAALGITLAWAVFRMQRELADGAQ